MVRARDHWFWIIPLSREKISVGVVMDTSRYRSLGRSPTDVLDAFLDEQPIMRERLAGARRVTKVYASGDYSYRNCGALRRTLAHGGRRCRIYRPDLQQRCVSWRF